MSAPAQLILTPGEPAGIGPDLALQYAMTGQAGKLLVIADKDLLQQRAYTLGLPIRIQCVEIGQDYRPAPETLYVRHVALATPAQPGQLNPANAQYVLRCLDQAIDLCLADPTHALITGPVHKGVINDAGVPFSGHTEYLAERSGTALPVMMLATTGLRVALATTHLPLAQVAQHISQDLLRSILTILHDDLVHKFHIAQPRISVCGLNPHAGESGHLGMEEITIIEPVLNELRAKGYQLTGPLPADTAFTPAQMQRSDAYLAMYHDQGLPVLKHIGFGQAVNITLGLPFIRTSVDHGTALELAGSGRADLSSLLEAIRTAEQMLGAGGG